MSDALDYLKAVALDFGATVMSEDVDAFTVRFHVVRADAVVEVFHLRIVDSEFIPKVFECEPRRLPTSCIDRHIVGNGAFCLSWNPGEPSAVTDASSAAKFWSRVDRFLQCQLTASELRQWPARSNARAHAKAATYQHHAEVLAAQLGPNVQRDLQRARLTVQHVAKRGKVKFELLRNGRRVARVTSGGPLVTTMTRCICDESAITGLSIGDCHDHAEVVADLIRTIYLWRRTHGKFVRDLVAAGQRCCGTLDVCEIRNAGALIEPSKPQELQDEQPNT